MTSDVIYLLKNQSVMKTGRLMIIFTIAASLVFMACDIYDDGVPAKAVRSEFRSMYPDAKDVEWDREGVNWSVSFEIGKFPDVQEYEALYDSKGRWIVTESDIHMSEVPQEIKNYLAASKEYGTLPYSDNEVELFNTPKGDIYRIELRRNGQEIDVDVSSDGTVTPARRDLF